jgi:hypothetical protein
MEIQVRVEVFYSTEDHALDGTEKPAYAYEVLLPPDAMADLEAELDEIIAQYPGNPDCIFDDKLELIELGDNEPSMSDHEPYPTDEPPEPDESIPTQDELPPEEPEDILEDMSEIYIDTGSLCSEAPATENKQTEVN